MTTACISASAGAGSGVASATSSTGAGAAAGETDVAGGVGSDDATPPEDAAGAGSQPAVEPPLAAAEALGSLTEAESVDAVIDAAVSGVGAVTTAATEVDVVSGGAGSVKAGAVHIGGPGGALSVGGGGIAASVALGDDASFDPSMDTGTGSVAATGAASAVDAGVAEGDAAGSAEVTVDEESEPAGVAEGAASVGVAAVAPGRLGVDSARACAGRQRFASERVHAVSASTNKVDRRASRR